jgi:hypothetical protein
MPDHLTQRWYAHPNDIIGGWSVLNVDTRVSQANHRRGEHELGTFMSEPIARHIVELHNAHLEPRR